LVFGPNGALYGTTPFGGTWGTGTIFELAPPASPGGAWTETVLYDDSPVGDLYDTVFPQTPYAGLTAGKKGVFYGTSVGALAMVFELKL